MGWCRSGRPADRRRGRCAEFARHHHGPSHRTGSAGVNGVSFRPLNRVATLAMASAKILGCAAGPERARRSFRQDADGRAGDEQAEAFGDQGQRLLFRAQILARGGETGELAMHLLGPVEAGQHEIGSGREAARLARMQRQAAAHEVDQVIVQARRLDVA